MQQCPLLNRCNPEQQRNAKPYGTEWIKCKKEGLLIDVFENKTIQIGNDKIYLSHFPHREWNCFYHNAYHLYSHCHGNIEDYKQSTDIGVDCWEYEPVEWNEIKQYIDENCESNI